ncbi:NPP1-domain-containing protein, partial [Colletotrichum somersetense]
WIDHDKVKALPQNASSGLDGELELRFNPDLYIQQGCEIYPAVDAGGNLSGGLRPTGPRRGDCSARGNGQVYARLGMSKGRTGIMYSYYVPKVRWGKHNDEGHRHYWASIVVWVDHQGCDAGNLTQFVPVGLSFTYDHTTWDKGSASVATWAAGSPRMSMQNNAIGPLLLSDVSNEAFRRTLVGWDSLPVATRMALSDVRYQHTEVPITDANFQKNMDAAYPEGVY